MKGNYKQEHGNHDCDHNLDRLNFPATTFLIDFPLLYWTCFETC